MSAHTRSGFITSLSGSCRRFFLARPPMGRFACGTPSPRAARGSRGGQEKIRATRVGSSETASSHAPRFIDTVEAVLRAGHSVRFRAAGWSMHPTIRNGEIITIAPFGRSPIQPGDVVLYRRGRVAIAHRVIRVRSSARGSLEFVVRGDAADFYDRPITCDQVLGRVRAVERGGRTVALGLLSRTWFPLLGRARRRARAVLTMTFSFLRI
jgi:hypothetical protein